MEEDVSSVRRSVTPRLRVTNVRDVTGRVQRAPCIRWRVCGRDVTEADACAVPRYTHDYRGAASRVGVIIIILIV